MNTVREWDEQSIEWKMVIINRKQAKKLKIAMILHSENIGE